MIKLDTKQTKIMKLRNACYFALLALTWSLSASQAYSQDNEAQLLRFAYESSIDDLERDYFLYLPVGYEVDSEQEWPVLVFLHGDGERGNGKDDLDFLFTNGPLYEAWIQKRNLPFIIVAPQLHMFGRDQASGPDYLVNRTRDSIPQRLDDGVPAHITDAPARMIFGPMVGSVDNPLLSPEENRAPVRDSGWSQTDPDLIKILDSVLDRFKADQAKVYLTGVSMGGFGTWHYASAYPERFAAILPIVGYPSVDQAGIIAQENIPTWVFSGGRDFVVPTEYFFAGMNKMDELGANFRFTTEQDMFHDVWNRVYAGEDVYQWLLQYSK